MSEKNLRKLSYLDVFYEDDKTRTLKVPLTVRGRHYEKGTQFFNDEEVGGVDLYTFRNLVFVLDGSELVGFLNKD